jgi:tetratricopeptide (TPR) repeat protein
MRPMLLAAALLLAAPLAAQQRTDWPQHAMRPPPPLATAPMLGAPIPAPADATVLFDGRELAAWRAVGGEAPRWRVADGAMEVMPGTGDIETRALFGDIHLHVEWASPVSPVPAAQDRESNRGQNRGNSGVFLMQRYEVQVLDSYLDLNPTYADGQAGAIYGQFPPRVNVTQPPGQWNSYDIEFRRPRFAADGRLVAPARMTVRHNGVIVHADVPLLGPTSHMERAPYAAHDDALPIKLQDHGSRVRFRNIWVRPLPALPPIPAADAGDRAALITRAAAEAGVRQFRAAIDTYTRGLAAAPDDALLLRWRGHRSLSVREFDLAAVDLGTAARLDPALYGAWYHLGVLRFARGEFAAAADAFRRAQPIAPDAGELAGSTDWLWMSLQRAGRAAEATAMLAARPDSLPVSNAYAQRLKLYRGEIGPEAVFTPADTADVAVATLSFGVGNWHLVRGDTVTARRWFERAVWSGGWPAFGAIVAEAELQRLRPR